MYDICLSFDTTVTRCTEVTDIFTNLLSAVTDIYFLYSWQLFFCISAIPLLAETFLKY